jgi:hypothetical protein
MAEDLHSWSLSYDRFTRHWVLKRDGGQRALKRFKSKTEALAYLPRKMPNIGAVVRIEAEDGVLQEERSFPFIDAERRRRR